MKRVFLLFLPWLLLVSCGLSDTPPDEEIVGADWRTWRGYNYLTLEHDGTREVLGCADPDTVYLWLDQETMVDYAILELPVPTASPDETTCSLRAEDFNGDGFTDLSADIVAEDGAVTTLTWLWLPEDGCFDAPMAE